MSPYFLFVVTLYPKLPSLFIKSSIKLWISRKRLVYLDLKLPHVCKDKKKKKLGRVSGCVPTDLGAVSGSTLGDITEMVRWSAHFPKCGAGRRDKGGRCFFFFIVRVELLVQWAWQCALDLTRHFLPKCQLCPIAVICLQAAEIPNLTFSLTGLNKLQRHLSEQRWAGDGGNYDFR